MREEKSERRTQSELCHCRLPARGRESRSLVARRGETRSQTLCALQTRCAERTGRDGGRQRCHVVEGPFILGEGTAGLGAIVLSALFCPRDGGPWCVARSGSRLGDSRGHETAAGGRQRILSAKLCLVPSSTAVSLLSARLTLHSAGAGPPAQPLSTLVSPCIVGLYCATREDNLNRGHGD